MTTQITNKQVKVITDVNFNNKEIINAKIDAAKNTLTGILTELVAGNGITITNNNVISLKGTQQLTDGTDIDTIKTEGNYFVKSPISTLGLPSLPTYARESNAGIAYWICLLLVEKEYGFGTNIVRQTITLTPIAHPMTIVSSETLMFTRTLCDNYSYVNTSWTKIDGDMTNITVNSVGSGRRDISISKLSANYCYLCQYMSDYVDGQIVHHFDSITSLTLTNIEDTPDEIRVMFKADSGFTLTAPQLKILNLDNIVFEQGKVYVITIKNRYATIDTEGHNPNFPTVNNSTITIKQGGETKGTFTLNQDHDTTIELEKGGSNLVAGDNIVIDGETISAIVPTQTSDLENNSGYITNAVDNLLNYPTTTTMQTADNALQEQINQLESIGRFLSIWDCITGLPKTNPPVSPYQYKTGDYFIVGDIGLTNYKPTGSAYTIGTASTVIETGDVQIGDTYLYDGTSWMLQENHNKTVEFSEIVGDPYDNENLAQALDAKQDKLVAGENITIDTEGNYWTNFGGENDNNLKLLNSIPSFSSIRIIFKASSYDLSFDDNTLLCRQDTEIYFGVQDDSHSPSIWTGDHWIVGQEQIEEKTNYWFCLDSSDGQTFTYYTIEDNNYTLNTLPQLSEWVEQCNINENFLSGENFYIGYNPFSQGEYWKGRLFECQIIIDNQEWFNLQTAEEGVDYENNGCEYVGELTNPIISAKNNEYKQSFNIAIKEWEDNRIEFKGYHYQVYDYTNLNIEDDELVVDCIVSENSLVFRNGQLLRQGSDYDYNATMWYQDGLAAKFRSYADLENWGVHDLPEGCVVKILHDENHDYETTYYEWQIENNSGSWVYLEDGFNDEPRFCTYLYNFKAALSQDDNIKIINGLHAQHFTDITGTVIDLGHYVQPNMIVLRNGILLCGENSWETDQDNENAIRLGTPLNENETLTIIPNYNLRLMFEGIADFENDRRTLNVRTNLHGREVLVWKDTLLQTLEEDYREEGEKIIFNEEIENDNVFVQVSIPQENSIYNAIGDKGTGEGKDITAVHYFGYNDTIDEDHKIIDTGIEFADSVYVYKNGVLLRDTIDYDINAGSSEIEFDVAIVSTDTITVINGDMSGIDMTRYLTYNSTATISNKTISANDNTISNLDINNFKSGVIKDTIRDSETATDTNLVTEKAVRTELDTKQENLIAGDGILLNGNVISSQGESSTGFVTWYDNNNFVEGDTEIQTQMATIHKVFRNGLLMRVGIGKDYTTELVNGAAKITFSIALLDTDEIAVE